MAQYTQMRYISLLKKGTEFPWMTDNYIWRDDAACLFSKPESFEVDELRRVADEEKKFSAAKKTCGICPVRAECLKDADQDDLMFTMRAGLTPLRHEERTGVRPVLDATNQSELPDKGPCPQGHNMWVVRSDGRVVCRQCKRDSDNRRSQKKREGSFDYDPSKARGTKASRGEPCKRGHVDWVSYGADKYHYCRTCKNLSRRGKL